jgi:D-sedoheptulose 7-phosphate isomerase
MSPKYFNELINIFLKIETKNKTGKIISFDKSIKEIVNLIISRNKKGNKVVLIGNGGSASIASHVSIDILKNAKIRSLTFNDASLLTCISNDLSYEYVFEKPIELLAEKGDILFSISSSGKSKNILNATLKAKQKGCSIITFSGFSAANPLRSMGDINFYVPSNSYGYIEITHLAICHSIVDNLIKNISHGQIQDR